MKCCYPSSDQNGGGKSLQMFRWAASVSKSTLATAGHGQPGIRSSAIYAWLSPTVKLQRMIEGNDSVPEYLRKKITWHRHRLGVWCLLVRGLRAKALSAPLCAEQTVLVGGSEYDHQSWDKTTYSAEPLRTMKSQGPGLNYD